jgi:PAS domain S-box-containing protein
MEGELLKADWYKLEETLFLSHSAVTAILKKCGIGIIIVDLEKPVLRLSREAYALLDLRDHSETIEIKGCKIAVNGKMKDGIVVCEIAGDESGKKIYALRSAYQDPSIMEELKELRNLSKDLQVIFDFSWDVIYVSDGKGISLRVSSACERLWGYSEKELVGRSVYELEKEKVFYPSITRMVLEQKQKVEAYQTTKNGRRLQVIGIPIFDEQNNIVRVVNASRDITDVNRLEKELEKARLLSERYRKKLQELREDKKQFDIIYRSKEIENIIGIIKKIAQTDANILISGESGVGKELFANLVHNWSSRKNGPLIKINCGAIPQALLESELFGFEKGSFTGASEKGKPGLVEMAHGGTLFLDEISELPVNLQVKLLRLIQEKEFVRVGGLKPLHVDIRIISATNQDLSKLVEKHRFRSDLYYRLNVLPITIPPLRERREDIPVLIHHFLERFNEKYTTNKFISSETVDLLVNYHWPGNVRELLNLIERLVLCVDEQVISSAHLPADMKPVMHTGITIEINSIVPLKEAMEMLEKKLVGKAYRQYGTTVKAAEVLKIDQSTASRKINRYCLKK